MTTTTTPLDPAAKRSERYWRLTGARLSTLAMSGLAATVCVLAWGLKAAEHLLWAMPLAMTMAAVAAASLMVGTTTRSAYRHTRLAPANGLVAAAVLLACILGTGAASSLLTPTLIVLAAAGCCMYRSRESWIVSWTCVASALVPLVCSPCTPADVVKTVTICAVILGGTLAATYLLADVHRARREVRELMTVAEASRLSHRLDLQSALQGTVGLVCELMDPSACVLYMYDPEAGTLHTGHLYYDPAHYTEQEIELVRRHRFRPGEGVTGAVALNRQPVLMTNTTRDARAVRIPGVEQARVRPMSDIMVPMEVKGELLGVLRVNRVGVAQYDNEDLTLARIFADQAAVGIANARLFETTAAAVKTARRKADEQSILLDSINMQVWYLSDPHTYGPVNTAHASFLGTDKSALEGRHLSSLSGLEDVTRILAAQNDRIFADGKLHQDEQWVPAADGTPRLLAVTKVPKVDEEGSVEYVVCTAEDITERREAELRLRESERRWQYALEGSGDGVWDHDLVSGRIFRSKRCKEILGFEEHEIGTDKDEVERRIHPQDKRAYMEARERHLRDETRQYMSEYRVMCRDGNYKWVLSRGKVVAWTPSGAPARMIGTLSDISDRKQVEEAVRQSEQRYDRLTRNAGELIISGCMNSDGDAMARLRSFRPIYVNQAAEQVLGYTTEEWQSIPGLAARIASPRSAETLVGYIEELAGGVRVLRNVVLAWRSKGGEEIVLEHTLIPLHDEQGTLAGMETIASDITERRRMEEKIRHLSFHDKLTGLYNRAFFEEELRHVDARDLPMTLIMGDVNGLKVVNDALGHQQGDRLLVAVAGVLRSIVRKTDLICRWGGDEFAIVLPRTGETVASGLIARMRQAFSDALPDPIPLSVALGMACKTSEAQMVKDVIKEAEDRMYRNKLLERRSAHSFIISSLQKTLWEKTNETEGHARRLQELALRMGQAVRLSEDQMTDLSLLALLHDLGKVAIPDSVLMHPGELSQEQWEIMKRHPEIGYRIAASSPDLAPIAGLILCHHEWWDGSGYPQGLRGEEIPLLSRILAVIDAYDVMIHGRTYREPVSREEALEELKNCAGTQFDPHLVAVFAGLMGDAAQLAAGAGLD